LLPPKPTTFTGWVSDSIPVPGSVPGVELFSPLAISLKEAPPVGIIVGEETLFQSGGFPHFESGESLISCRDF
jgi:hypothetical protein